MVNKKTKSKRLSTRQRAKIHRKAKEHHRKLRKDGPKGPRKSKKDPGIPNLWPYKEQLLKQIELSKQNIEEEKNRQKLERQELQKKNRKRTEKELLMSMRKEADQRTREFDREENGVNGHDEIIKDNSRRAYYKEFKKVVEAADVLLEVLDARDPEGCRCRDIEQMILASGSNKKIILVINKIDLVPKDIVEKWLKRLRNEFPAIAFKASTQEQRQHLGYSNVSTSLASENLLSSSECLGADTLVRLLKNYCRSQDIKTSICVGVVGYPNVGKSSLINSLKRSKACGVGATPGFTKNAQEIHLDKNIKLLDCPGIVFSDGQDDINVLLRNCVKLEQIEDPIGAVDLILKRCKKEEMMMLYALPNFGDANEFLLHLAKAKGKLKKGGVPDLEATAISVLRDWNTGKIAFYTLPPIEETSKLEATIVNTWSREFKLEEIVSFESASVLSALKSNISPSSQFITMVPGQTGDMAIDSDNSNDSEREDVSEMEEEDMEEEEEQDFSETDEEDIESMEYSDDDKLVKSFTKNRPESKMVLSLKKSKTQSNLEVNKKPHHDVDDLEAILNPRINQQRKKILKQMKRDQRRSEMVLKRNETGKDNMDKDEDDSFDFAHDFVPLSVTNNDSKVMHK